MWTVTKGAIAMSGDREQSIRERAYELWERAGSPEGRDEEFWQSAERELLEQATGENEQPAATTQSDELDSTRAAR